MFKFYRELPDLSRFTQNSESALNSSTNENELEEMAKKMLKS
jgi:hypothetical protein